MIRTNTDRQRFLLQAAADEYRDLGLSPIPLDGKVPNVVGWPITDYTDAELGQHLQRANDPGIGVKMGPIIDVEWDTESQREKAIELFGGELPKTPCFKSRKGSHYLFKGDSRLIGSTSSIPCDDGTNLLIRIGPGAQSAFPPSRDKEWILPPVGCDPESSGFEFAPIPEPLMAALLAKQSLPATTRTTNARPVAGEGVDPQIVNALKFVSAETMDIWSKVGLILKGLGEHYWPVFEAWSLSHPKGKEANLEYAWDHFAPNGSLAVGTIFHHAKEGGFAPKLTNSGDDGPLGMREILSNLKATGVQVQQCDGVLFVHDPQRGVCWLKNTAALFGYLAGQTTTVWSRGGVTKDEFFAELCRVAPAYDAISDFPHYPTIPGVFYTCSTEVPAYTGALDKYVDFFCPAFREDRELLKSIPLTLCFGQQTDRTNYAITCERHHAQGDGKNAAVRYPTDLVGGCIAVTNKDASGLITRMLSPDAAGKRAVLIGNATGVTENPDFAELMTSRVISGRRLYHGDGSIPNLFTWFLTGNNIRLDRDLAQRVAIIYLAQPKYDPTWETRITAFMEENRDAIIGDCLALLAGPKKELLSYSRRAVWDANVLACLDNPDDLLAIINERANRHSVEHQESDDLEQAICEHLEAAGFDPLGSYFIPNPTFRKLFNQIHGANHSQKIVTQTVNTLTGLGNSRLAVDRFNNARGVLFAGRGEKVRLEETDLQFQRSI
ncbi:PriCT-2 domain-containing protein [Botrimarina mediterranea]|uniref:Primase C-terminal 2 domain-containing protein n=1 Tax=Botrimarina mediterranea TaxID=2528022 RepID=A0A518K3T8_9BACT|nr:PriCT-2 domain-containing protein [Botrimarina mediterranea]QDV72472.1 hypothetical protein Spa11_06500 [Botrimarina mediterranea]QDV77042.1 hypothetical protein K2D_06290 [Planctomycetes bacterium K2D]